MLILSRKTDEDIVIGDGLNQITIRVVAIRGDKVRLGFIAPTGVTIMRKEVQIKQEKIDGVERPDAGGPLYSFS